MRVRKFPALRSSSTLSHGTLCLLAISLFGLSPLAARAQVYFAGTTPVVVGSGFSEPEGVVVDAAGDVFVADYDGSMVKEILAVNGSIPAANPTINILGSGFSGPQGVAVDTAGDVFVADTYNGAVKEILAVNGSIPATNPTINTLGSFYSPFGVAVDAAGDVFVADPSYTVVKEILAVNGSIPTTNPTINSVGSGFLDPEGVAVDSAGDVFVADEGNNEVKEILAVNGSIPASNPTINILGGGFYSPYGVALDAAGDVFVADGGHNAVKEILVAGGYTTVNTLGSGFVTPTSVAVDVHGDVFVADFDHNEVKEFQAESVNFGSANVCPSGQTIPAPCSQTLTLNYNVDANTTIGSVKIFTTGATGLDFQAEANDTSTTLCSAQTYSSTTTCTVDVTFAPLAPGQRLGVVQIVDGSGNVLASTNIYGSGTGPAMAFSPSNTVAIGTGFRQPLGVAVDADGDIFVADGSNSNVQEILAVNGSIPANPTINILGSGFSFPSGVAVDGAGDVFVADTGHNAVKEIVAVNGSIPATNPTINILGSGFNGIYSVAVDAAGDVFVADFGNNEVKEIVAVNGSIPANPKINILGSGFDGPTGVAVDATGDVFVADFYDNEAEEIVAVNGNIPASNPTINILGGGYYHPTGVTVDEAGDVFVVDSFNSEVKEIVAVNGSIPATNPTINTLGSGFSEPFGVAVDAAGDVFVAGDNSGEVQEITRSAPPSLSFASTNLGSTSSDSPQSVQFQNVGNATLTGSAVLSDITDFTVVAGPGTPPDCTLTTVSLTPAAECNLSIDFAPQSSGPISATITATDNTLNAGAPNYATQVISLSGTGVGPILQATPVTIQFGTIAFGSNETLPLTISNTGGGTLTLNSISISGHGSYAAVMPDTACAAGVAAGSSCVLQIEFSPTKVGEHIDYLTLNTNGGTVMVKLRGFAVGVSANVDYLPFSTIPANQTETLTVPILNYGEPGTPTVNFAINGPSFKVMPGSSCVTPGVASGQTCTVQIEFVPGIPGLHTHTLTITPSEGTPSTVDLHGRATTAGGCVVKEISSAHPDC
jgi:streptogramin lyase